MIPNFYAGWVFLSSSIMTHTGDFQSAGLLQSFAIVLNPAYMLSLTKNQKKNIPKHPLTKSDSCNHREALETAKSATFHRFPHVAQGVSGNLGLRLSSLLVVCMGQGAHRDSQMMIANVAYTNCCSFPSSKAGHHSLK